MPGVIVGLASKNVSEPQTACKQRPLHDGPLGYRATQIQYTMQRLACRSRANGAMLGLLVGDAAGVPLEFLGRVSPSQVENALLFPGGGVLRVGRYQVKVSHISSRQMRPSAA